MRNLKVYRSNECEVVTQNLYKRFANAKKDKEGWRFYIPVIPEAENLVRATIGIRMHY